MRLLIYTAAIAVVLFAFGYRIETTPRGVSQAQFDQVIASLQSDLARHEKLIEKGHTYDCAWIQFEDYSLFAQADDRTRYACAGSDRLKP